MRVCPALIVACFFMAGAWAQPLPVHFTSYSTANGLPDNSVQSILQDSRGFMWFGTREGLGRFDGTGFKNFFEGRDSTAMHGNNVNQLLEYKPGHLIFNSTGGVTCLNTITQQFYYPALRKDKPSVWLHAGPPGSFFMTRTDTCFVFNGRLEITDTLVPPLHYKNSVITAYVLDTHTWLLGSEKEYYLYNPSTRRFTNFLLPPQVPGKQPFFSFHYYDAAHGRLYFSSFYDGLFAYSPDGRLLYNWPPAAAPGSLLTGNISFVTPKNDSTLWVGTYERGIHVLNTRTARFRYISDDPAGEVSAPGNGVLTFYTDRQQNEWIGHMRGVSRVNAAAAQIKSWCAEFGGAGDLLHIVKGSDGNMYQSLFGLDRCFRINPTTGTVSAIAAGQLPSLWCSNTFGNEIIFTGAGTTITRYNPVTGNYRQQSFLQKYFPQSEMVILALKQRNGDEWYSGNNGGGLVRVSAADGAIHHYKKDGPRGKFTISYYVCHAEDANGDLWLGVNKSSRLLHWDRRRDSFSEVTFDTVNGAGTAFHSGIQDMTIDREGNLWLAFDGSGVLQYNPATNSARQYAMHEGLPTNYISSLLFDDKNRLWIGTIKGLSCLLVKENRCMTYTIDDGLPEDLFYDRCLFFDSATHRLWAGAKTTLMSFDPDRLLALSKRKVPVYIDEIALNSRPISADAPGELMFRPSQNNLQFHFIGVDFNNGKSIEYSYRLAGADQDWIYNNNITTASYANLGAGHYAFSVRARHKGDTEWSEVRQPFTFFIQKPWYKTWWFRALLLLLAIAALVLLLRRYLARQLEKQKIFMEKELAIEQERTRMARELHDGLGSMLSGIKHSFTAMQNRLDLNESQQGLFHRNIDKLNASIRELRSISHSMGSDALLQYGLESSLSDYCHNIDQAGTLRVAYNTLDTERMQLTAEQAFHLFRIAQELLQNIIRHSGAANAIVQISYNAKHLYLAIEDDGRGFDKTQVMKSKGMGLRNIESRIKILRGRIDYQAAPGKGTSVLIEIPCGEKASVLPGIV